EHGCTAQGEITITENILPIAVKLAQTGKIKCAGDADAALETTVSGGKPPYTYQWKSKNGTWSTANINQLKAGIYSLSVTDASGLSGTADFEITEPKKLEMAFGDITPASTNNKDGKVVVHANGGTADYTMEGKLLPAGSNTFTFDRLEAGKHLIVVIDAMGCKVQDTVLIPENILPLNVTIFKSKAVLCHGNAEGGLGTKVDGGKGPYTYKWSNGVSEPSMTNLKAGKYSLTVTDATGQSKSAEYAIDDPPALALTLDNIRSATNDRIHDGKANVVATGGTGTFTYQWSSGETFHQATQLPLGPGKVIVTDQNLCTAVADFTITQKVLPELTTARLASGEPIRMEKIQFA
ncbi:MAG TPA: SprB repeat-containing protein, partial [Saprospiraceae bacterium]|nr:SprB repeat-containing protein [Saprospiraceae bacterium]